MTSRQNSVSTAAASAISPPGSSPILKQQQQPLPIIATSPRVSFMTPPENNGNPGVMMNNSSGAPNNASSGLPPGVANPLGGMALPLALLAQHQQQLQMAAAVAGNQQPPPIYIYPPGIQPFPCYFPGAPLPYPHPGAPTSGPFSPAAATTAAIMAAMTAGVPHQNNQPLPGSPFFGAPGMGTHLTPVFRFNQPQTTPQPPPPLPLPPAQPAQQPMPNNNSTAGLPPGLQQHLDQAGENRRTIAKTSIGVGHDGVILSPPSTSRLLPPSIGTVTNGNDGNITGNATAPVNNIGNSIVNNNLPPSFNAASSAAASTTPSPHHHSTSSLTSPSKQALVNLNSPPGVSNLSSVGQHVIRQNPLSSHDNNAQQQQQQQSQSHHHHHYQSGQQPLASNNSNSSSNSTSNRQRKRPPNLTIPISNFDVPPANSSLGSEAGNSATAGWPPNTPGGTNLGPIPKTPKTAPTLTTVGNNNWPQRGATPRGGLHGIASAGPRQRGRPPLHHKPQINSADQVMAGNLNGFPSSSSQNFSSSSSTYNSPNLLAAPPVANSATSYSTGSDLSVHHQQEVVINSPSHLLYPDHFKRGSLIRLADGTFKCVEDMSTSDFTRSAQLSGELQLDSSQVLQIEPNPARGAAMLYLAVGDQSPINIHVEAPLEHPFFVYNVGWSSCDPDRTRLRYGLSVSQLRVGDKCISLTRKPPTNTVSVSSSSVVPVTLPPPPPPTAPVPARRTAQPVLHVSSQQSTSPPSPPQPTTATTNCSAIIEEPSSLNDDTDKHEEVLTTSTSVNKAESEAEMESIATASLLSLQQSSTKLEAVSPLRIRLPAPSAAVPTATVTPTATTAVIRSTEHHQVSISPPQSKHDGGGGLLILNRQYVGTIPKDDNSEPAKITVDSPKIEDPASVASEPLVADGVVNNTSPKTTVGTTTSQTPNVKSRFATHHPLPASKPRLLLFPGHHLAVTGTAPRPGSSSFVGLRRRRHRSTSALALADLSPKSKCILLQKDTTPCSSNDIKSLPNNDNNNNTVTTDQQPPPPSPEPDVAVEVVETSSETVELVIEEKQSPPQEASLTQLEEGEIETPLSSSVNDDDIITKQQQDSEPMQVDEDHNSTAETNAAVLSDNV